LRTSDLDVEVAEIVLVGNDFDSWNYVYSKINNTTYFSTVNEATPHLAQSKASEFPVKFD